MKKIFESIIFLFVSVSCIWAMDHYMSPFDGSYAIPMDSPAYTDMSLNANPGWTDKAGKDHDSFLKNLISNYDTYKGMYSDFSMISAGGFSNVDMHDYDDLMIRVTVESPAGLNFVSLSNPSISRPYGVAVFGGMQQVDGDYTYTNPSPRYMVLKNSGDVADFKWNKKTNGLANWIYEVYYDMVLILPGDWDHTTKSKTLADEKNRISIAGSLYELAEADDYSSVVNVKCELYAKRSADAEYTRIGGPELISLPLSGYYHAGAAQRDASVSFGMHIMPNNNCANLNINQQQGKMVKIADVNLLARNVGNAPKFPGKQPPVATDPGPQPAHDVVGMVYPKHSVTGKDCIERPTEGSYGYYNRGYKDEQNGGWPKYQEDAFFGDKPNAGKYIEPQTPRPDPDQYRYGSEDKYRDDLRVWEEIQNKSGNYALMLKDQKQWDENYAATAMGKEWIEKHNAWVKYDSWTKEMPLWQANPGNDMFVFFSSNADPTYPKSEHFMLVHEDKPGDTPLNARNHIKFILVSYDKETNQTRSFDGTDYFDPMGPVSQFEKMISTNTLDITGKHSPEQHTHKYDGEVYLVMESKPDQVMIRGKYSEKIYVHVVGAR